MADLNNMWKKLEKIRQEKLISYNELAEEIGISERTLFHIKSDNSRQVLYKTLRKIKSYIDKHERK